MCVVITVIQTGSVACVVRRPTGQAPCCWSGGNCQRAHQQGGRASGWSAAWFLFRAFFVLGLLSLLFLCQGHRAWPWLCSHLTDSVCPSWVRRCSRVPCAFRILLTGPLASQLRPCSRAPDLDVHLPTDTSTQVSLQNHELYMFKMKFIIFPLAFLP